MQATNTPGRAIDEGRRVPGRTADRPGRSGFSSAWPDLAALTVLHAIGVALPVILGAISGSILVPHNDDPSMRRVALGLFETGRLGLNGWTSMTLVGQVLFVQPFLWLTGGGPWAFAAATSTLAILGIVSGYLLARRLLSTPRAVFAVLGILLVPGFLLNTTTFMTDVPAWSASLICLALGAAALDRTGGRRGAWLAAALIVGCFAFSVRDFAIAAPAGVLIAGMALDAGGRRRYWLAGGAVIAACAAIYLVCLGLPGRFEPRLQGITSADINGLVKGIETLGLVLSPAIALAWAAWWRRWRVVDWLIGGTVGLLVTSGAVGALLRTARWPQVLVGNLLEVTGTLGTGALAGGRPVLFRPPAWDGLNAVALGATIVLFALLGGVAGAYGRRLRRRLSAGLGWRALGGRVPPVVAMVAVFALVYGVAIGSWSLLVVMLDRYLWPLVLPIYLLLLVQPEPAATVVEAAPAGAPGRFGRRNPWSARSPAAIAGLLLAGLAATSTILLLNADAFEAARWQVGDTAVARGYAPATVDAGLEWVAFNATGVATPYAIAPPGWSRYGAWWPPFRLCAMASTSPLTQPGFELIGTFPSAYRLLLFVGPDEPLYLYRVDSPGCPA